MKIQNQQSHFLFFLKLFHWSFYNSTAIDGRCPRADVDVLCRSERFLLIFNTALFQVALFLKGSFFIQKSNSRGLRRNCLFSGERSLCADFVGNSFTADLTMQRKKPPGKIMWSPINTTLHFYRRSKDIARFSPTRKSISFSAQHMAKTCIWNVLKLGKNEIWEKR